MGSEGPRAAGGQVPERKQVPRETGNAFQSFWTPGPREKVPARWLGSWWGHPAPRERANLAHGAGSGPRGKHSLSPHSLGTGRGDIRAGVAPIQSAVMPRPRYTRGPPVFILHTQPFPWGPFLERGSLVQTWEVFRIPAQHSSCCLAPEAVCRRLCPPAGWPSLPRVQFSKPTPALWAAFPPPTAVTVTHY